jgi:4-hydroxy-tetrahydrodipicolinate reductase
VALLVGVTGLDRPEHQALVARLRALSHRCAVLVTPNTSLGVAAVAHAAAGLARALGPGYSWTMAETHHTRKKDAPSGTALRLAQAIASGGVTMEASAIRSIREGEVVGTHTIAIEGPGEVIELTHRATTRDLFAHGALRCCAFLAGRPAGWYTMEDVVGRA